jgi:hypothetical protein
MLLGAALALALVIAGCGAEERESHNRPPQPVSVTVSISGHGVLIQPARVGFKGEKTTNISQNETTPEPQANRKQPLPVTFTISNLTEHGTALLVVSPGAEQGEKSNCDVTACSNQITPGGTGELKTALDAGEYQISARDIAGGKPVQFSVGPERPSSQQDLLLP